jgi:hypothetical protein
MFSIRVCVRTREALDPVEKLTDWEFFQSPPLNSYLRISKFTLLMELIKQHACDFAASVASAHRLSTKKLEF